MLRFLTILLLPLRYQGKGMIRVKFEAFVMKDNDNLSFDSRYVSEDEMKRFFQEDGFDVLSFLKLSIRNWIQTIDVNEVDRTNKETVTLYHGTTSTHLNNILLNGILPSNQTKNTNWDSTLLSAENATYMTNKWHYHYAFLVNKKYRAEQGLGDFFWEDWDSVPTYIECEVPKYLLLPDEDSVHSSYFSQKLKTAIKKEKPIELSWEESLAQYGTVAVLGGIKREYIKSITLLGDRDFYIKNFLLKNTQYAKEVEKWSQGKGKGKLKNIDMIRIESESALNSTLMMSQIPAGHIITGFRYNQDRDNLDFVVNKIKR